jgi:hypothetical protein
MREQQYLQVTERLHELILTHPGAYLVCPLGAGHMYDHVELFTACIRVGHELQHLQQMLFYEDSYAILTRPRKVHFLLKDYTWESWKSPQNTSIWWRMMGWVMSGAASDSDIRTCIPDDLGESEWKVDTIPLEKAFEMKMESLSKYRSQMKQFGGMKRVGRAFRKYHEFWKNGEPYWYIE